MVVTFKQASVSLHSKPAYLYFFVFKMYSVACYESESRTQLVIGIYPEVTGSVKSRKWNSHKLFSLPIKEKFVTFFSFGILQLSLISKWIHFTGETENFSNQHGRHAFRFLGSEKNVNGSCVSLSSGNCLTHEQNFFALIKNTSNIRLSITDSKTPRKEPSKDECLTHK